jgi:hypothetical protein
MELSDTFQKSAKSLMQAIQGDLSKRGIKLKLIADVDYEDPRCHILEGQYHGASIHVQVTNRLNKLDVTWGPQFVEKKGMSYIRFSAYSYEKLLKRLHKFIKDSPATAFGSEAVEAWFKWVHGDKTIQKKFAMYQQIISGELSDIVVGNGLHVPIPDSVKTLIRK